MSFQTREEFVNAQASEKITVAHVHATSRLYNWTNSVDAIYTRQTDYFVSGLAQGTTSLTEVSSVVSLVEGSWYFDRTTSTVYVWITGGGDPQLDEMVVTYRFFYSDAPVTMTPDLADSGDQVYYHARIKSSPGFKHKVGVDQKLVSVIGQGDLKLENNDGGLDDIYDTLFFENQKVEIYSWNRDLDFSEAKAIYRGRITNKRYNAVEVVFTVKDLLYDLLQNVPQTPYDDTDNVVDSVKGNYKRWLYGRVEGLKLQSIDQIGDGYTITGTVSVLSPKKEQTRFEGFPAASSFPSSGTGAYFIMFSVDDQKRYIYWYDVDNGNTVPSLSPIDGTEDDYIEINVNGADVGGTVSEHTSTKLADNFTIISGNGYFTAENEEDGVASDSTPGTSGVTMSTIQQGIDGKAVIGVGTVFLSECSPEDTITIGTQEFTIDSVEGDNNLTLSDVPDFIFTNQNAILKPNIPTITKNRQFFVAGHATSRLTKTVVSVKQFNRIELNNTVGLQAGDFVEFNTGERIEIKRIVKGNIIVLRNNVIQLPTVGTDVTRQPIQDVFIEKDLADNDRLTINNNSTETTITLDPDIEFQLAKNTSLGFTATFTNGSRSITTSGSADLRDIVSSRDWIRPSPLIYTTYYEILEVKESEILLRTPFIDTNVTSTVEGKLPNYIGDDTIISANVLGRTVDNTPDGEWIQTAAQTTRDLLDHINMTNINETSFTDASASNRSLVSIAIPLIPEGAAVSAKNIIDKLAQSTTSALTLDNNLDLQYRVLIPEISDDPPVIKDEDVITWSIQSVNGDMIRNSLIRYRHKDIDRYTQEQGNNATSFSSDFVETYIGTNTSQELDVYLYEETAAKIMSHREIYIRSLARAQISIRTDLRLEGLEIGDTVVVDFDRLYKRFGDSSTRKKVCMVIGKTVTGTEVELFLTDLGNVLNRTSIITPNSAPDWTSATSDEKLKYGYITDSRGIVNDEEETANTHLIT